jgi:hypothetical protein
MKTGYEKHLHKTGTTLWIMFKTLDGLTANDGFSQ